MKFRGLEVSGTEVAIAVGAVIGGGACYALLKHFLSSGGSEIQVVSEGKLKKKARENGRFDQDLPLLLEQEYGSFRELCLDADPLGAEYLQEIPDHFFAFPQNFFKFICNFVAKNSKKYLRVLVVGSRTGYLVFALGTLFEEVKGIESSFSQVVTCYQFQNFKSVTHGFPAEGSYKVEPRTFRSPISKDRGLFSLKKSKDIRKKNKENVEFINASFDKNTLFMLGSFQVVILQNCLEDLDDPVDFLNTLKDIVVVGGFLVISADYNWQKKLAFPNLPESSKSSFLLLRRILERDFEFKEEKNIPETICESVRSCRIRYNHVTAWIRVDSK